MPGSAKTLDDVPQALRDELMPVRRGAWKRAQLAEVTATVTVMGACVSKARAPVPPLPPDWQEPVPNLLATLPPIQMPAVEVFQLR